MPDTINDLVRFRADHDGDTPMVIDPTCRVSYRDLDSATRELAAAFVEAGVGKGTRVGLIMPNSARWVQVAIALTRIGAVLVPLSTLLAARELVAQLRVAAVQFLVSVDEFGAIGISMTFGRCRVPNFLRYARFGRSPSSTTRRPARARVGSSTP